MTFTEINKRVKAIRELIKKVKFEDALSELVEELKPLLQDFQITIDAA